MTPSRSGRAALWILIGALMLTGVTVLIGRPTVFTDTDDYYAEGRGVVRALSAWIRQGTPPIDFQDASYRLTHADGGDEEPVHNQDGARSVYYGLFLYLAKRLGSVWLMAFAQAGVAAALVYALWRTAAPGARPWTYPVIMAGLSLGSALPVFTGFLMPDVFAGFSVLSVVLLTIYADRLSFAQRVWLWLLLAAGMNFHGSNLPTCLVVAACALALAGWSGASRRALVGRGALVVAAAVAALGAASAYGWAVRLRTGDELGRPPFLMARVLADGPGRAYLRSACAQGVRYALCAYRRLPLDDSEDILWSDEPTRGIFNLSDFGTRQRLEHEETRFVLAAVASDPLRQIGASLRNWGMQLADIGLDEPLRDQGFYLLDPYWKTTTLPSLIRNAGACAPARRGCAARLPAVPAAWIYGLIAVGSLGLTGWRLWREGLAAARTGKGVGASAWTWLSPLASLHLTALLLVVSVMVNAGVCGVLSGTFARYQSRILWLLPFAAMLLLADGDGGVQERRRAGAVKVS